MKLFRHLIPPAAVLLTILCFSLWTEHHTAEQIHHWDAQLRQTESLAAADRWDPAAETLRKSYGDWCSHQTFLRVTAAHSVLDEAEVLYRRSIALTAQEDAGALTEELSALRCQLRMLAQQEETSVQNIL